jgi:DHA3 family macrolide efflux protein-like MFS transporter
MRRILPILIGQFTSYVGSHLAVFGLAIWTLQQTGSMSIYALVILSMNLPQVLVSPLAGAVIDRWDRRSTMLFGLTGSCMCSALLALLAYVDILGPWSAVVLIVCSSSFSAFTAPAYDSLIAVMVPSAHLNRVNGLVQLGVGLGYLIAPISAGFLLPEIGLNGIYFIDVLTFVIAIWVLGVTRVPKVRKQDKETKPGTEQASFWREAGEGWRYVRDQAGMMGLLVLGGLRQLSFGMVEILFSPLVIAFAGSRMLGLVHSVGGLGFILGSILTTAWLGPRRLLRGMLLLTALQGMVLFIAVAKPSVALAASGAFGFLALMPFIGAYYQTIWQRTTPLAIQGRVFAFRHMLMQGTLSAASLLSGVLGDYVFEPLMAEDGLLASSVGRVIGTGEGRGAALLIAVLGVMSLGSALFGAVSPSLRRFDEPHPEALGATEAPDTEATKAATANPDPMEAGQS